MWVNKSVNPSQTSTRAAQAVPPRLTPMAEQRRATPHTALRAELFRRNGPEGRFIAPAPRGSREALRQRSRGTAAQIPAAGLPSDAHAAACAPESS
jgi:hypothetical protein